MGGWVMYRGVGGGEWMRWWMVGSGWWGVDEVMVW